MASTSAEPVIEFSKLSRAVSLYTPASSVSSSKSNPTTIIICQWMGASPRSRALRFLYENYSSIYPQSRIITVSSLAQFFITTSNASRLSNFAPIVSAISSGDSNKRILVHLFSNGGALSFCDICHVYKQNTGNTLPVQAIVLDSAPGDPTLKEAWAAMSIGLPRGLLWYPVVFMLSVVFGVAWFMANIFCIPSIIQKTRKWLNDFSLVDGYAKRLYIYSREDKMVGWEDVERHAEEAEKKGAVVSKCLMKGSPHVQHMLISKDTYWKMIESLWKSTGH